MWVCPPLGQFAEGSGYQKYARSAFCRRKGSDSPEVDDFGHIKPLPI